MNFTAISKEIHLPAIDFSGANCWFGKGVLTLQGINISHLGKRKNHLQNAILGGYVSSLEGICLFVCLVYTKNTCHIIPTWVRMMEETLVGMKKSPFSKPMKNIRFHPPTTSCSNSKSSNTTCKVGPYQTTSKWRDNLYKWPKINV